MLNLCLVWSAEAQLALVSVITLVLTLSSVQSLIRLFVVGQACFKLELALARDLLVSLLVVTSHSLLFLKLLEHQGLLVAVDDLI